jgi:hypothetical protein
MTRPGRSPTTRPADERVREPAPTGACGRQVGYVVISVALTVA